MTRYLAMLLLFGAAISASDSSEAAPTKKKYHYELTAIQVRPEVKADTAAAAKPRVEGEVKKAFESHPQLVANLDDAPPHDDRTKGDPYRQYLAKKGLSGSFLVTVDITEATETIAAGDKPNTNTITTHVALHMLGETIPERSMGFTGDGKATVTQEVGRNVRDKDRAYGWDQATDLAVADAIKVSLEQLDKPKK